MKNTIVHYEGTASLEAVATKVKLNLALIKIRLDMHARLYLAVAQYDHLLPKAARRFSPNEFVPWVKVLLGQGHAAQRKPCRCRCIPSRFRRTRHRIRKTLLIAGLPRVGRRNEITWVREGPRKKPGNSVRFSLASNIRAGEQMAVGRAHDVVERLR